MSTEYEDHIGLYYGRQVIQNVKNADYKELSLEVSALKKKVRALIKSCEPYDGNKQIHETLYELFYRTVKMIRYVRRKDLV